MTSSSSSSDVWTCPNCTLINEKKNTKCEACYFRTSEEGPLTPQKLFNKAQSFIAGIPEQLSSAVNSVLDTPLLEPSPPSTPLTVPHYGVVSSPALYDPGPSTDHTAAQPKSQPRPPDTPLDKIEKILWTCGRCTFINTEAPTQCSVCGAPERFKVNLPQQQDESVSGDELEVVEESSDEEVVEVVEDIFCESCGFQYRTDKDKQCPVCSFDDIHEVIEVLDTEEDNAPMETSSQSSGDSGPRKTAWRCPLCTYENKKHLKKCKMCHKNKDQNVSRPSGTWACSKCSYENNDQSATCTMCEDADSEVGDGLLAQDEMMNSEDGGSAGPSSMDEADERAHSLTMEIRRKLDSDAAMEHFERIRTFCSDHDMPFVDDSFPPAPRSLFGMSEGTQLAGKVTEWRRPDNLRDHLNNPTTPWQIYRDPVSPSDISQGILGDCWFLSSLSVLAERPELVERIMISKDINPVGAYQVRLCNDGAWQTILIDNLLPAGPDGALVCSKAKRKQLWVPLIEKALAKVNGSYESLISGRCLEGLATLTGAPCECIQLQEKDIDKNLIWAKLLSSKEVGFLMGASCGGGQMKADREVYESVGLRPRHSYSVLDVQDICGHKLLRLRNPWGHFSWKGDWSDDSPRWTQDLREALGAHAARDGVFWMSLEDLLQYFDTVDISKVRPSSSGWSEFRVPGTFPATAAQPCKVVVLTLDRPTEVDFTLYQTWRKSEMAKSIPLDLMIIVVRARGDQVVGEPKVVAYARRQLKAFVSCSAMLEAGDYIVICCSFNTLNLMSGSSTFGLGRPYILAIHTSRPVFYASVMKPYSLIARSLIALAVQKGKSHEGREGVTCYYLNKGWSGTIIVAENRYPDHHLHLTCDCNGSFNVVATRGSLETADSIPPLHRQIVTILSQCVESGYTINHHIKNRMSASLDLKDWGPPRARHDPSLDPVLALHNPIPL